MSDDRWWRWYNNISKYQAHRSLTMATAVAVPHLKPEAQRSVIDMWQELIGSTIGGAVEKAEETAAKIGDQVRGLRAWLAFANMRGIDSGDNQRKLPEKPVDRAERD